MPSFPKRVPRVLSSAVEWTRDLGDGRFLVMEHVFAGYRAAFVGFRGVGTTQDAALEDLLARIHEQLRQIKQLGDQIARGQLQS